MNILLFEDNINHVDLFESNLHLSSYANSEITVIASLEKGKGLLTNESFDIIFLDLSLKDSDMKNTISHIKDLVSFCPVVVLTSLDDKEIILESIKSGADDCFPKSELSSTLLERAIRFNIDRYKDRLELKKLTDNLNEKVKLQVANIREKDALLIQQSKLAAIGEMIGAIAHQWRQPLNALSIRIGALEEYYDLNMINKDFIENFVKDNTTTIQFMSDTIDNFRNFFKPDKEASNFDIKQSIIDVISIQKELLENNHININLDIKAFRINGFENEFKQVILNIISNAKDALISNCIANAQINIKTEIRLGIGLIIISDNGGGIDRNIIDRIYEPYFTTKEQGSGTGIGLYMSKMIIEKNMHGILDVKNIENGTRFTIQKEIV